MHVITSKELFVEYTMIRKTSIKTVNTDVIITINLQTLNILEGIVTSRNLRHLTNRLF